MKTKKNELSKSKVLLDKKFPSYLTQDFHFLFVILRFPSYVKVLFSLNASPKRYRPSKTFFWTKLFSKNRNIHHFRDFKDAFLKQGFYSYALY